MLRGGVLENCPVFFNECPHAIHLRVPIILSNRRRLINNMTTKIPAIIAVAFLMLTGQAAAQTNQKQKEQSTGSVAMKQINPKSYTTFKVSDSVDLYAVNFKNQYKMNVAGHLFIPKNLDRNKKNPAIIVGHPMGAVKEQSADVYAAIMAERGFITLAVDLSFWGQSEGEPRNAVAPDIY